LTLGVMNYEEQQKALQAVQRKYSRCPNCGIAAGAEIGDVVGLPVMERTIPSGVGLGGQVIPALPVTCKNCGHISLFSAKEFITSD